MEDNKLKDEIIEITGNVFPKDSIVYKELYELTADIAVKFAVYYRLGQQLPQDFDYGQIEAIFTKFITHIYQPR